MRRIPRCRSLCGDGLWWIGDYLLLQLPTNPQDQVDQGRKADEDAYYGVDMVQGDCGAGADQGGTEVDDLFVYSLHGWRVVHGPSRAERIDNPLGMKVHSNTAESCSWSGENGSI